MITKLYITLTIIVMVRCLFDYVSGENILCLVKASFMILQDVYGTGGSLSEADRMALAIISYIGCGVSFIAMCLTLLTFFMFK